MLSVTYQSRSLVMNAPQLFARADFRQWLNDPSHSVATWHKKGGKPSEYSDVYVLVDCEYEGDSSNMPEDAWKCICDTVYATLGNDGDTRIPASIQGPVSVRLTNLAD